MKTTRGGDVPRGFESHTLRSTWEDSAGIADGTGWPVGTGRHAPASTIRAAASAAARSVCAVVWLTG
ncbi:MAG TPA: hypothetical protein VGS19_15380 [Streptosporangiaceae bacterium]|nr:hypothetical protein [Streptosporangiaceae bacterium]